MPLSDVVVGSPAVDAEPVNDRTVSVVGQKAGFATVVLIARSGEEVSRAEFTVVDR